MAMGSAMKCVSLTLSSVKALASICHPSEQVTVQTLVLTRPRTSQGHTSTFTVRRVP